MVKNQNKNLKSGTVLYYNYIVNKKRKEKINKEGLW